MNTAWKVTQPCKNCKRRFTSYKCQHRKYCCKACYTKAMNVPVKICPTCKWPFKRKGKVEA